jgi:GxxExxY protein
MKQFILKAETYKIIGSCMEVHKHLGRGFAENIYKDVLQIEFVMQKIPFQREQQFGVLYKEQVLPHVYRADFVVFDKIILELKAVSALADAHVSQTINYMSVSGCKIGLLINFNSDRLEYHRFVL